MIVYISSVTEFPKNLLKHILEYYTKMGVDQFYFTVYGGESAPAWKELKEAALTYRISFHSNPKPWSPYNDAEYKEFIRQSELKPDDFMVPSDFDEFHFHPQFDTFPKMVKAIISENADFIKTRLIDRIKEDGSIPAEIESAIPLIEQFPRIKPISSEIMGCYVVKMIMTRQHVPIGAGHHVLNIHNNLRSLSSEARTNHYKWFGDLRAKEKIKIEMYKSLGLPWWKEQENLFKYLDQTNGIL